MASVFMVDWELCGCVWMCPKYQLSQTRMWVSVELRYLGFCFDEFSTQNPILAIGVSMNFRGSRRLVEIVHFFFDLVALRHWNAQWNG